MLGWLRSLVFAPRGGEARTAPARTRPVLSLECLDPRSLPSVAPVVALDHIVDVLTAQVTPAATVPSVTRADLGSNTQKLDTDEHTGLSRGVLGHALGSVTLPDSAGGYTADGSRGRPVVGPLLLSWASGSGPIALRSLPSATSLGLLLDEWRHDSEALAPDWLMLDVGRRMGPVHLAPNQEGSLVDGGDDTATVTHRARTPAAVSEGLTGVHAVVVKAPTAPVADRWVELTGQAAGVNFRDITVAELSSVPAASTVTPAVTPANIAPAPQVVPDKLADANSLAQLLPEAATFLSPIFPFDAAGLQDQVARFRSLLEPVVPVIEQYFTADEWWVSAATIGMGAGVVLWYRRSSTIGRGLASVAVVGRGRSERGEDESQKTLPARPYRPSLEVAEVGAG